MVRPFDEGDDDAGDPAPHPEHDHGAHRPNDLRFESVLLQLDGADVPEGTLGTAGASPAVVRTTRFELHVRPMFRLLDRDEMLFKFDLWSYDDVKANAPAIQRVLQAGTMPLALAGGPWPAEWVQLFERWVAEGFPRLALGSASQGGYTARRTGSTVRLTAKGTVPAEGFRVWLEAESVSETARRYTLVLEPPEAAEGTEKPFTAIANFEAPITLRVIGVTDADGTHVVPVS